MTYKAAVCPVCGYKQPVTENDLGKTVVCELCGVEFAVTEIIDVTE